MTMQRTAKICVWQSYTEVLSTMFDSRKFIYNEIKENIKQCYDTLLFLCLVFDVRLSHLISSPMYYMGSCWCLALLSTSVLILLLL